MRRIALAWLDEGDERGPETGVAAALARSQAPAAPWDEIVLLSDLPADSTRECVAQLAGPNAATVRLRPVAPGARDDLTDCLRVQRAAVLAARRRHGERASLAFYLGHGVGMPAASWALLAATEFPAALLRWTVEGQLVVAPLPLTGRLLDDGIDLQALIAELARDYLGRALVHTDGNKTAAARLLRLRSYQTLDYWVRKYGLRQ